MAIDPCTTLNTLLETKVSALETIETGAASQIASVTSSLNSHSASATNTDTLSTALQDLTADELGSGTSAVATISTFTGSCLNDILGGASSGTDAIKELLGAVMDTIGSLNSLGEKAISQALQGLRGVLGALGIPALLADLDSLMGCMSDSGIGDCSTNISSATSRIDSVLGNLYLDSNGDFDMDDLMDATSLAEDVKTNLNTMRLKFDVVESVINTNISNIPSVGAPESYY